MNNHFTKLPDGTWGIRVYGSRPEVGDRVSVVKQAGPTSLQTVARARGAL